MSNNMPNLIKLCPIMYTTKNETKNPYKHLIHRGLISCGDKTRTCDLRVMSPTSYQLLHPAPQI